jgi:dTMP kinase
MIMEQRGLFILVEGGDRCGKSTLAKNIHAELLKQQKCTLSSFPDRTTTIGQMINSYLKGTTHLNNQAIHLLFSANRHEKHQEIIDSLKNGTTIVMDRYVPSGVAYSAAKGLEMEWCKAADEQLPKPDIIFFVKLDPQSAATRAGYGEERFEKIEFQEKVSKAFDQLIKETSGDNWVILDGNQSPEAILKEAVTYIQSFTASPEISFY